MRKLIYHMLYRVLGVLPGVLAVAFAMAQKPVQTIPVDQCDVIDIGVQEFPGDRYIWDLYTDPNVNFAQEDGDVDWDIYFEQGRKVGPRIRILNLPHGTYFLRVMVWDDVECTNNLLVFKLDVAEVLPTAELEADPYCEGDYNEVKITFTGRGPWDLYYTWDDEAGKEFLTYKGIVDPVFYLPIPFTDPGRHSLWVMEVKDECSTNTYEIPREVGIIIHAKPKFRTPIRAKQDDE